MAKRGKQTKAKSSETDKPKVRALAHLRLHPYATSGVLMKAVGLDLTRSTADAAIREFKASGERDKIISREKEGAGHAAFDRGKEGAELVRGLYEIARQAISDPTDGVILRAVEKVVKDDDRTEDHLLKTGADTDPLPIRWHAPTRGRRIAETPKKGKRLKVERYTAPHSPYLLTRPFREQCAFIPHAGQAAVAHAWETRKSRHVIVRTGRRFGKSQLKHALIDQHAHDPSDWGGKSKPNVMLICPTNVQAVDIYWKSGLVHERWEGRGTIREGDHEVLLKNGGRIAWRGVENPGAREGQGLTMLALDEAGLIRDFQTVFNRTLLPMLMDARARALISGTPKGHGDYYGDLFERGTHGSATYDPDWLSFQGASIDNTYLAEDEIESMRLAMDWHSFQQEILGLPTARAGKIFAFERERHVGKTRYIPGIPLCVSWDFNVSPMSILIGQHQQMRDDTTGERWQHFVVLGEMSITDTNTAAASRAFLKHERWGQHRGGVQLYGDATGGARDSTSGTTDWAIIERLFGAHYGREQVEHCYLDSNPSVIDSDNAVNAALDPGDGRPLVTISSECTQLVKDLENLTLPEDGSRRHAKARAERKGLGHMADALRYWIARERPIDTVIWSTR